MLTSLSLCALVACLKRGVWPAMTPMIPLFPMFLAMAACVPASPSRGDIIYTGSSVVFSGTSASGLSARATFTTGTGGGLRLLLENTSRSPTLTPSELLTSFYFNVLSGTVTGSAAPLASTSATGQVYRTDRKNGDAAVTYTPPPPKGGSVSTPPTPTPSNLMAINPGDNTWQFRSGMSLAISQPPQAFGVGTVGNNSFAPDNFNGNVVDGFDFGIYVGDVTTQNLDNTLLVGNAARFEFGGFEKFTLAQVSPHAVFGFGTNPEIIIAVPEPATASLAAAGLIAALAFRAAPRSLLSAGVASIAALGLLSALP